MKKIFLIILILIYNSQIFAAGPAPTDQLGKTTVSTGVKPSTKYSAGKKWVSKAKKFEKKIIKQKLKMLMKKL